MRSPTSILLARRPFNALIVLALLLGFATSMMAPGRALAASFTVTKTADTNDGVCNADCSLREAISAANASPGADTINVPAGTYQLTLANSGGTNEDNNATGDLDVRDSLTIQGAGSGSTIIEAGTTSSNGIDKVFALNPICTSPINVTIDGVTVRFGRNTQPSGAADFSFTGGGIDWCSAGAGGTFTLSNSVVSDNTNVNGYGGGLNVDTVSSPTTVNITNVTFSNNQTLSTTQTANGGAINLFGDSPTVTISNSSFSGNHTSNPTSGGGAIYFRPTTVGHLSISGSSFTNNTAAGIGGAIATDSHGAGTTISIQTSSFGGNTATNSFGGALKLDGTNLNTTPFSLTHLKITGNSAGTSGGGLFVGNSNVTLSKSLIVGNSAPTASGLRKSVDAATATVTNNWWGCSTGPAAAPCDTASTAGGTLNFTPWYRDQLTATTSPVAVNQSTSLTASFLTNSASTAVPLADLAELLGRSVSWAATGGNLSGTQGTVQASATATGSFQATAAGTAVISAKVDNDTTAPVSSNVLSLPVAKADTTAAITNGSGLSGTPSVTGQAVAVSYSVTGAFGNSPTAPTGSVTVSDGTDSCTGTVAAGSCNLTFRTAGAKTLTATYAGDANFNASPASTSASHTVNKANTTTTITSDTPDPSVTGQTVTFAVSVAAMAPGAAVAPTTITGSVVVSDGGTNSCTATLTAGAGACTIAFPSAGSFSMTGAYGGDVNFNGSTSAANSHTVNKADTTTTITSDIPDPSIVGQAVTVNFTVVANAPGAGTPTGNVTVSDGVASCIGSVSAGSCSLSLGTSGARPLTATYAGNSNFNASASAGASHTVDKSNTTTTVTSDTPDPSAAGQPVTVKFSVLAVAPGAGTPTGNVTVSDGTDSCIGTVATGQCTITFASIGNKSLTATYAGDSNFNASASAAQPHAVNRAATTISSINRAASDPTNAGSVTWTVVFTDAVSGLTASNFAFASTGLGGAPAITAVTPVGGAPATNWNVTISTGTGDGTLDLSLLNDANLDHMLTNLPFVGQVYTIDRTAPTVTINQAAGQADPTDSVPINFTVIFSEPVTGFTSADVNLSGTAGATSVMVTGSGTTYNVAVSGIGSPGTVIASIPANAADDLAGNGNAASTSTDNVVTVPSIPRWHVYLPLIRAP